MSANDNTVTGPQQRFNTYQEVGLAVYKTSIRARSLKEEFSPFFSVFLLQMFSNFLPLSCSVAQAGWIEKAVLSVLSELNTYMVAQ